jgi:hypothetical protein
MKRNYVPADLIHHRSAIAERNRYLDKLCADLAPVAQTVYANALKRRTSKETADILVEEARATLKDLLTEAVNVRDEEAQQLTKELEKALEISASDIRPGEFQSVVKRDSADLARALVGFWFDLGSSEIERYKRTVVVSIGLATNDDSDESKDLGAIGARFGLERSEAYKLLGALNASAVVQEIAQTIKPSRELDVALMDIAMPEMASLQADSHTPESYRQVLNVQFKGDRPSRYLAQARGLVKEIDRFHMANQCEYAQSANPQGEANLLAQIVNVESAQTTWDSLDKVFKNGGLTLKFKQR